MNSLDIYMKTIKDINSAFSDYIILLGNNFLLVILSVVTTMLLTRILGDVGYGQYNLFNLVVNLMYFLVISGTSGAV